jgi:hypothetical protein
MKSTETVYVVLVNHPEFDDIIGVFTNLADANHCVDAQKSRGTKFKYKILPRRLFHEGIG